MSEPSTVWQSISHAVIDAGSNPKVATAIGTATASVGAASKLELIQGFLSTATMAVGLLTASVVLALQLIKFARRWKAWREDKPDPYKD